MLFFFTKIFAAYNFKHRKIRRKSTLPALCKWVGMTVIYIHYGFSHTDTPCTAEQRQKCSEHAFCSTSNTLPGQRIRCVCLTGYRGNGIQCTRMYSTINSTIFILQGKIAVYKSTFYFTNGKNVTYVYFWNV